MRREENAMRAAMPGMVLVMVLFCMMVLTIIVGVIGLGMIIYHSFKQPFEERPLKKIGRWVNVIFIMMGVTAFVAIIAYAYGCI